MKLLVCGGRNYGLGRPWDVVFLYETLDDLHINNGIDELIHGGATGADFHAGQWAEEHNIPSTAFPADWIGCGKAAGPIRNQHMIDSGKPDLVLALPGGKGTADLVTRAKRLKVPVMIVEPE